MIAGCYDLHLYCDGVDCARGKFHEQQQGEFTGDETGSRARARARRAGWKLFRDGRCLCPGCKAAGVALTPLDPGEPDELHPVTHEDVQRGGLAAFAVHVQTPTEWSSTRRSKVVRRVARMMRDPADQPGVPYPKGSRALGKRLRRTGVTRGRPSKEGRAAVASMVAHATRRKGQP